MKLAIYGVSRAGKDYLIKKIVDNFHKKTALTVIHLEGSKTLKRFSQKSYGVLFQSLCESQRKVLRKKFTELVNEKNQQYDIVIVDGHYSFINEDSYHVVFTEEDRSVHDHFFYLDTPSKMIVEFSKNSVGEKRNVEITEEQISDWKTYEKSKLEDVCSSLGKELVILDEDTESSILFIESWVESFKSKYCFESIANEILDKYQDTLERFNKVLLLDCDRTVSINDVTYDFCEELGISSVDLKKIFRNDRYTSYQFYKVWCLYTAKYEIDITSAAVEALTKVKLSQDVYKIIKSDNNTLVMGLTSGVLEIWKLVSSEYSLFDVLIGNTSSMVIDYYVTPLLKKAIAHELQKRGKEVIAIGDSLIDIPMLEAANQGYLVAHEKINKAVARYLMKKGSISIKQLFRDKFSYNFNHESSEE